MRFLIGLLIILFHSAAYCAEGSILIFVSFSMPNESIKGWINDAEKIHAPVLIRGLVNNSFKETTKKMIVLSEDNHGGVQLDPQLFKALDIKQVPAVVVTKNIQCVTTKTCGGTYDVVSGDVHLEYALEKIVRQKDELSPIAEAALKTLRGYHHA